MVTNYGPWKSAVHTPSVSPKRHSLGEASAVKVESQGQQGRTTLTARASRKIEARGTLGCDLYCCRLTPPGIAGTAASLSVSVWSWWRASGGGARNGLSGAAQPARRRQAPDGNGPLMRQNENPARDERTRSAAARTREHGQAQRALVAASRFS